MNLLLIVLVAFFGSAIAADDDPTLWTKEMVDELFSKATTNQRATIPELIASNGFPVETHHAVTEDGYILEMYRIPGSSRSPRAHRKPVFFLMHGLLSSAADWVVMGPEKGFGYILANEGFDVWMGNARGNTWSKNHTENLSNRRYWDFSWHQIGYYDLPAMIDYALAATGEKQVFYAGHSQGTTSYFVMGSERPEYNNKIRAMFALAPVAYMGRLFSPVLRAASLGVNALGTMFSMIGYYEFLPSTELIGAMGNRYCHDDAFSQALCTNLLFLLCGFNQAQLNATMLPTITQYAPAGASTNQLVHYGQGIRSRRFRQLDLGGVRNRLTYGQWTPPDYDLSKISSPVHLIYSDNDWMAAVRDVEQLWSELGNGIELYRINDPRWNHLDFIWGIDAKEFIYDVILDRIKTLYSK